MKSAKNSGDKHLVANFIHSLVLINNKNRVQFLKTKKNFCLRSTRQTTWRKCTALLTNADSETATSAVNYGQIFLGGISIAVGSLVAALITGFLANMNYEEVRMLVLGTLAIVNYFRFVCFSWNKKSRKTITGSKDGNSIFTM
jgi:hypothetical protein